MALDDPIRLYAAAQAPAFEPKAGRHMLAFAAASLLLFAAATFSVWLLSPPLPLPEAPAEPVASVQPSAAALAGQPVSLGPAGQLMVRPPLPASNRKQRLFLSKPGDICRSLAREAGAGAAPWAPAPVEGNGWECLIGPMSASGAPAKGDGSSIFVILRGVAADDVTQFSLMANIIRPGDAGALMNLAAKVLGQTIFPEIAVGPDALAAFAAKRAFRQVNGGDKVEVIDEGGSASRLRLIARFAPRRPAALPAGAEGDVRDVEAFRFKRSTLPDPVDASP